MAPPFDTLLDAIAERSAVMRSAATDLEARVPGCPDWSVRDLLVHVGQVQLSWAAKVHALGAEARHQVQEATVHAYDVQSATGAARDLPVDVAVDAVDEFLVVGLGAMEGLLAWASASTD